MLVSSKPFSFARRFAFCWLETGPMGMARPLPVGVGIGIGVGVGTCRRAGQPATSCGAASSSGRFGGCPRSARGRGGPQEPPRRRAAPCRAATPSRAGGGDVAGGGNEVGDERVNGVDGKDRRTSKRRPLQRKRTAPAGVASSISASASASSSSGPEPTAAAAAAAADASLVAPGNDGESAGKGDGGGSEFHEVRVPDSVAELRREVHSKPQIKTRETFPPKFPTILGPKP